MLLDRSVLLLYTGQGAAYVSKHCACILSEPVMLMC
jgi:hypothetical protein